MRTRFALITAFSAALLSVSVSAQVRIGNVQIDVPATNQVLDPVIEDVTRATGRIGMGIEKLAQDRLRRIDRLVRRNRDVVERDAAGNPARRGSLIALGATGQEIAAAQQAGYSVSQQEDLTELGLEIVRIALPSGKSLPEGERELRELMPNAEISPDNLYFQAGGSSQSAAAARTANPSSNTGRIAVGMIDGAPDQSIAVEKVRGFSLGAGRASDHGSAVASLLGSAGVSRIMVADVYGSDPAGGNATAIARALAWLVGEEADVITVSLVGPDNSLLARAFSAARQRGVIVVAAVGNDGPAAPPAFPASYDGVVAVTAVDRQDRALIEAGRALHLDYAAPGADIFGMNRSGRSVRLRGTSFATPLVAARIAHALAAQANWRQALDREAIDLGERGPDETYGRGLVCRGCGQRQGK